MFEVAVATDADARIEVLALVGDAVVIRVGVLHHVVGGRLVGQDAVAVERNDGAREDELVDKNGPLVEHAVAFGAFEARDAAFRQVLPVAIGIAHVGDELGDVHPAVAVEPDHRRADDVRFCDDELHAITRRKDERLRLFVRSARDDRGFW